MAELQSASVSDQLAVTQSGGLSRLLVLMFDLLLYFFVFLNKCLCGLKVLEMNHVVKSNS